MTKEGSRLEFRVQSSEFRFQISDFRVQLRDHGLETSPFIFGNTFFSQPGMQRLVDELVCSGRKLCMPSVYPVLMTVFCGPAFGTITLLWPCDKTP
jgi:hypothetical protein